MITPNQLRKGRLASIVSSLTGATVMGLSPVLCDGNEVGIEHIELRTREGENLILIQNPDDPGDFRIYSLDDTSAPAKSAVDWDIDRAPPSPILKVFVWDMPAGGVLCVAAVSLREARKIARAKIRKDVCTSDRSWPEYDRAIDDKPQYMEGSAAYIEYSDGGVF